MLLAGRGADVCLYEAGPKVGGRTARLTLQNGPDSFHFDTGPTFFLMPHVLEEIFAAAGTSLVRHAQMTRLDPMYRLVIGRAGDSPLTLDTTQDLAAMGARLNAIAPGDGDAFGRFMSDNRRKLEVFTPILRSGFTSHLDLLRPSVIKAGPWLNPHQSVHAHLSTYFKSRESRLAMTFQSKYLGMSPMNCPSLFSILPFIEYEYGVWHPQGGCNALMAAMARVCTSMGVQIRCGAKVERVVFEGKRACGVVVGGESIAHDHVVANADASWALKNLVPAEVRSNARRTSDERVDAMKYSCSTMMLYLGVRGKVNLPHHTIKVSSAYEQNLSDIVEGRLSAEPSFYVCNPSAIDPTLAPEGCSSLYVLVPTPNLKASAGSIDWAAQRREVRDDTVRRVSALAGVDLEPLICCEKQLTPLDWAARNINFGATFNLAHNLTQMLHLRPQHEVQGLKNMWLVGGGTHPGSGLPVIFLSAQITAAKLAERAGLPARSSVPQPLFAGELAMKLRTPALEIAAAVSIGGAG